MTASTETDPVAGDQFFIPDEKAAPKVGATPSHHPPLKNLAGDEELVDKVRRVCFNTFKRLAEQTGRDELEASLKEADQMYRMSSKKPDGKAKMKTVSNVREGMFAEKVDAIHANEMTVLIQDDELPAKYDVYEQGIGSEYHDEDEARAIANARQMLAKHTWEMDERKGKVGEINFFTNKYGNAVVSDQWDRIITRKKVRVPSERDKDGIPKSFKFVERKVIEKDCPTLKFHDFKDVWYDTNLDCIEDSPVVEHAPMLLNDLYAQQEDGQIMNVGKIKKNHLYLYEPPETDIRDDRYDAADEDIPEDVANGTIDQFHFWIRLPINKDGKWDESKTLSEMCFCSFAGPVNSQRSVCLRIVRRPYNCGGHHYHLVHSHPDDKGGFHDGLAEKLASLSWQAQTNLNQHIDGKDLIMRRPWTIQGQVLSGDTKFQSANKMLKLSFGAELKQLEVGDTSQTTIPTDQMLQEKANKISQVNKPFLAEPLGGRTSATESKNIHDAAVRPGLLKVDYFAEQLFVWLWRTDAERWEQFGDPKRQIRILGKVVNPATLWGPSTVKVSAITEYANSTLERQQTGAFLAQNYGQFINDMTPEERRWVIDYSMRKVMKIPLPRGLGGTPATADSEAKAREEAGIIINGGEDQPVEEGQNHAVHVSVKQAIIDEAKLMVKTDDSEAAQIIKSNLPRLEQNVLQHKQMEQQAAAAQSQAPNEPVTLDGNATGNLIEAEEGAIANV